MVRSPPGPMALTEGADESCHYRGSLPPPQTDVPEAGLFCSRVNSLEWHPLEA